MMDGAIQAGLRADDEILNGPPMDDEQNLNLNGEFLGITSLAIYSAPWYLQLLLLVLVGLMFFVKIAQQSKRYRERLGATRDDPTTDEVDEMDEIAEEVNRVFFGFSVARRRLPVYWLGASIYVITFVHAAIRTVAELA